MKRRTNLRRAGGNIAGPGGPHDRNAVILHTADAVLLGEIEVVAVMADDAMALYAMSLGGRINKTSDYSRVLYLFDVDCAASVITELRALAARAGPQYLDALTERVEKQMDALRANGNLDHREQD